MDIQSYIKSGRIEHYVLGLASPEDSRELERIAAQYPEFMAEINRVHEALGKLAAASAIAPPPGLKEKIMDEVGRLASGMPEKPRTRPAEPTPKSEPARPTAPASEPFIPKARPAGPAAFIGWALAGLLALGAAYLFKTNMDAKDQIEAEQTRANEAIANYEKLNKDCSAREARAENLKKQIAFARDPATKTITMRGVEKSPNSLANVVFNANKKQAFIEVASLPAPPTGKQYQLWAIRGEDKISMGVFDLPKTADEFIEVPFVDEADAFAVTLENQGGSPVPTLEEMYVVGAVEKPKPPRRRQSNTINDNG